jgi:hypothetical protein
MSIEGVNRLIGLAVVHPAFADGLVNGRRAELLRDPRLDLEPGEREALLRIRAESFRSFAAEVERWLDKRAPAPEMRPPPA